MGNCEILKEMFAHMKWADGKILQIAADNETVRNDEKVISLLTHIIVVQYAFLHLWKSLPLNYAASAAIKTLDDVMQLRKKYHCDLDEFLKDPEAMDMERAVVIPWSGKAEHLLGRVPESTRLQDTMLQVTLHSQYHRAQVNSRIRELGVTPPMIDFIAWVWMGRP